MTTINFERLSRLPFLQDFTQEEMGQFFAIGRKVRADAGTRLMATGDKADCFYVLALGQAEISISGKKGEAPMSLAQVGAGQLLGEMPLLYAQPLRQADVHASTDVVLLRFDYTDLETLSQAHPAVGRKFRTNLGKIVASRVWSTIPDPANASGKTKETLEPVKSAPPSTDGTREYLRAANIFTGLSDAELAEIEAIAVPLNAQPDQAVVRTGDPSDSFFIVTQGALDVIVVKDRERVPVARLSPGQVFGEMALVYMQKVRTADVVAVVPTRLLSFPFEDYQRLVTARPEIGKRLRSNLGRVAASRVWSQSN
jgi:CRP-like cAMP-binding protein